MGQTASIPAATGQVNNTPATQINTLTKKEMICIDDDIVVQNQSLILEKDWMDNFNEIERERRKQDELEKQLNETTKIDEQLEIRIEILKQKKLQERLFQAALKREKLRREALQQEQIRQEKLKQEQLQQEKLKQEQLQQERLKQEQLQQEKLKQEQLRQEKLKQEQLRQKQLKQEQRHQEELKREQFWQEKMKQEKLNQKLLEQELLLQVKLKQEQLCQEQVKQGQLCQEQLKQEHASQNNNNDGYEMPQKLQGQLNRDLKSLKQSEFENEQNRRLKSMEKETQLLSDKLEQIKLMEKNLKGQIEETDGISRKNIAENANNEVLPEPNADRHVPFQTSSNSRLQEKLKELKFTRNTTNYQSEQTFVQIDNTPEDERRLSEDLVNLKRFVQDIRDESKQEQENGAENVTEGAGGLPKGQNLFAKQKILQYKFQIFQKQSERLQAQIAIKKFKYMQALDKNANVSVKSEISPQNNQPQQEKNDKQGNCATKTKNRKRHRKSKNTNPSTTGSAVQTDYSQAWVDYYRSLGMYREAETVEQQAKSQQAEVQINEAASAAVSSDGSDNESVANSTDQQSVNNYTQQNSAKNKKSHEVIHIKNNATGFDYHKLFSKFLGPFVTDVHIDDPYINKHHQIINFLKFCEMLVQNCDYLKVIKLLTMRAKTDKELQEQNSKLGNLRESLIGRKVKLLIEFSETQHAREIRFNTGWVVKIDRGLDMFKFTRKPFAIGYCESKLRPCYQTTVNIFHMDNVDMWST